MTATPTSAHSTLPTSAHARTNPNPGTEFLTVTTHPISPSAVLITVRGEVDLLTSPLLLNALLAQLHSPGRQMIVDLTAVGFFGAAGLTVLATARQATLGVDVVLLWTIRVGASPRVRRAPGQIRDGLRYVLEMPALRTALLALA